MTSASATSPMTAKAGGAVQDLLGAALAAVRARPHGAGGPGWLEARRAEAGAWLEARGFPSQRDEAWRFTPTRDVTRVPSVLGPANLTGTAHGASGIVVQRLSEALASDPGRLEPHLGQIAAIEDGFSALNGAAWQDGIVVFADKGARGRVELVSVGERREGPTLALPRVLVVAERDSDVTLVESHSARGAAGTHLSTSVTEIVVGEGARVEHVRVTDGSHGATSVAALAVRLARSARYGSRVFTFGGSLSRLDLRVTFAGEGGECALDGLFFAGDGELVDHHTTIDHAVSRCSSRERYKGSLDGTGIGVFDGTVLVRHGAQRTEAHQESRNLLLSGDAVIHTKPHLRIDADDVKCSHGATVGRLDPAQLFYLRSRGMDAVVARSLLTYAFLREMTAGAPEDLRSGLDDRIAALLPGGAAVRELA